jgi:hypothetical protein
MKPPPPPRLARARPRLLLALFVFLALCTARLADFFPSLPQPLALDLQLEPGTAGRSDPLIVSGKSGQGDFLVVRFETADSVRFVYDSWGRPGLGSEPVPLPADRRLALRVALPALDRIVGGRSSDADRIRVEVGGRVVLDSPAFFFPRAAADIHLAVNPLGGTACGASLHGTLRSPHFGDRPLRGSAREFFTVADRVLGWSRDFPGEPIFYPALAALAGLLLPCLPRLRHAPRALLDAVRAHRWFVGSAIVATTGFAWIVTMGSFSFNHGDVFGNFYDHQAASLLEGRLDVPEIAIGSEAFEARGKLYGYFGPTPALLRLPFVAAGVAFGQLTRASLLLHFAAALLAAYLILLATTHTISKGARPSPFSTTILILSTGLGSTLFFLGSRAYVFHEAILCGIAFALWSVWFSLRHLYAALAAPAGAPLPRLWLGALACALLSLHARPPTGLFALTLLGCVGLAIAWRRRHLARAAALRHAALVGTCAAVALFSLHGLAWLKFGIFDPAPLRISRPYLGNDRLAAIDGKSFHLVNLPFNFHSYVSRPNLELKPNFPWIYHGRALTADDFPRAKVDLPDHTVALTYASSSLFLPATLGSLAAVLFFPALLAPLGCLWLAALPMSLALFAAIATAQRYTGDFCPFLIAAAAVALATLDVRTLTRTRWLRFTLIALTAASLAITGALTLHYQRAVVWGVPDTLRADYQQLRQRVDAFFGVPPLSPPQP